MALRSGCGLFAGASTNAPPARGTLRSSRPGGRFLLERVVLSRGRRGLPPGRRATATNQWVIGCSMQAQASRKTAAPTRALCAIRCAFSGSPFGPPNCRAESMLDEMCRDLRALRRRPLQETPSGDPVRRPLQETLSGDPVRRPLQGTPPRYRLLAARNLASQSPGSTTRFPTGYPSIPLCENT